MLEYSLSLMNLPFAKFLNMTKATDTGNGLVRDYLLMYMYMYIHVMLTLDSNTFHMHTSSKPDFHVHMYAYESAHVLDNG